MVEDTIATLYTRIELLRAALRPFANAGKCYRNRRREIRCISTATGDVTAGDLEDAALALERDE